MAALSVLLLAIPGATPLLGQSIHDRIYPAPIATATLPAGVRRVTVITADGLSITGAEIAAQQGKSTPLVFHGNGSSAMATLDWFAPLIARKRAMEDAQAAVLASPGSNIRSGLMSVPMAIPSEQ